MQRKTTYDYARMLCECAIMVALAFALSFIGFSMPMGGKLSPASMLPLFLIAIRHGTLGALGSGAVYALLQIFQSAGSNLAYIQDDLLLCVACILFDYVIPFMLPFVFCALFLRFTSRKALTVTLGVFFGVAIRFLSHFISGVLIWGQWAEGTSPYLYSLLYNGAYMLPEAILTAALTFFLLQSKQMKKLLRVG